MIFYAAIVEHRHGTDLYTGKTESALYDELYAYVNQWWGEEIPEDYERPTDPVEAVEAYFEYFLENDHGGGRGEFLTHFGKQEVN